MPGRGPGEPRNFPGLTREIRGRERTLDQSVPRLPGAKCDQGQVWPLQAGSSGQVRRHVACCGKLCARHYAYVRARSISTPLEAVANRDHAMSVVRDVGLVGDEDDGVALGVQIVKERHDLH